LSWHGRKIAGHALVWTGDKELPRSQENLMHADRFPLTSIRGVCLAGALALTAFALHAGLRTPTAGAMLSPVYEPVVVDVGKVGNGSGTVAGGPINCGTICSKFYARPSSTTFVLTATPSAGSVFAGWSGCYSSSGPSCTVKANADSEITARFETAWLTVASSPSGGGSVTGTGIDCSSTCSYSLLPQSSVSLTATAAAGYRFDHWSGACSGTSSSCLVQMSADAGVTAHYVRVYALSVTPSPFEGGIVTGPGIYCSSSCTASFDAGTTVTVSATAWTGWVFTGWSGCPNPSGANCTVTLSSQVALTASFARVYTLTIDVDGGPSDHVDAANWSCSFRCTYTYVAGSIVQLAAVSGPHSGFASWGGSSCSGAGQCLLAINGDTSVSAKFLPEKHRLTTTTNGAGSIDGTGWSCASSCAHDYAWGSVVTLTAVPGAKTDLSAWSGCDSVSGLTCTVTVAMDKDVTATFVPKIYALTVVPPSGGKVTGNGVNCGFTCSALFNVDTVVTLTPIPLAGYRFTGWTGACSGIGACPVTMDGNKTVGATFAPKVDTLAVTVTPAGAGTVTVTVGSISYSCTSVCNYALLDGTSVSLARTATTGYTFVGWSGDCSGATGCSLVMNGNKSATAAFA
jgi:uncharacterized repeat protein (TIGR02543 family)